MDVNETKRAANKSSFSPPFPSYSTFFSQETTSKGKAISTPSRCNRINLRAVTPKEQRVVQVEQRLYQGLMEIVARKKKKRKRKKERNTTYSPIIGYPVSCRYIFLPFSPHSPRKHARCVFQGNTGPEIAPLI